MLSGLIKFKKHVQTFFFKMASVINTSNLKYLTVEEVIERVFTDADSADEAVTSESETETPTAEEDDESGAPPTKTHLNNARKRGPRTRGGLSRTSLAQKKRSSKEAERVALADTWKRKDSRPHIPEFTSKSSINAELPDDPTPLDFLDLFLDEEFYGYLTTQTNPHAAQYLQANPNLPPHSRFQKWKDVSVTEMKQFIALYLLTGIIRKPEVNQYWSTNPLLKTPFFNNVMPRNRFQLIFEFFHFNDNSNYSPQDPNRDRLFKIHPVLDYLMDKFNSVYTPDKHIAIDEELLLWKRRLGFKQYIRNKRARFGIKMFSVCEVSGYLWNSFVYVGKNANETLAEQAFVKELGRAVLLFQNL